MERMSATAPIRPGRAPRRAEAVVQLPGGGSSKGVPFASASMRRWFQSVHLLSSSARPSANASALASGPGFGASFFQGHFQGLRRFLAAFLAPRIEKLFSQVSCGDHGKTSPEI